MKGLEYHGSEAIPQKISSQKSPIKIKEIQKMNA